VNATLQNTNGVAVGRDGTVYFADAPNHAVRAVDPVSGIIRTFAGNGVAGYDGDNVHVNNSRLNTPRGVATGQDGGGGECGEWRKCGECGKWGNWGVGGGGVCGLWGIWGAVGSVVYMALQCQVLLLVFTVCQTASESGDLVF
jgi:hypothetical protein